MIYSRPIKELVKDHLSRDILKLWITRITFYLVLFILIFGISHFIVLQFGPDDYDMTSAQYMISALIQSEAAIMAIIVTLSLVAVELASSSYSVRMMDLLKGYNPDFWILVVIYIVSMIYGLFVLKSITNENIVDIHFRISFVFHIGVYSFLILFPYLFVTLNMLKPSTLLGMQAMKITVGNITAAIGSDTRNTREKDPIQPIIDIISSSLLNHDFETTRNGLNIIGMRAREIFVYNDLKPTERKVLAYYIFSRLARFGKFTLNHSDEDATFIVIRNLEILWKQLEKSDPAESVLQASSSLEQIGTVAAGHHQKNVLSAVIDHLYYIGQKALDKDYDGEASRIIDSLRSIGISCMAQRADPLILEEIINYIGKLGAKASKGGQTSSVSQSLDSMNALQLPMELIDTPEYQRLSMKAEQISKTIDPKTIDQEKSNLQ
ncbi:hypothetical protein [Methanolobus sp. WCC5]|uniref:hypothetical protein n=1 Tax=Methanolobus sp. WCC5 TaxID=3125785 RepID=UPI00324DADAD